ncbi:GntR family transcriptional regulator [Terrabacter terrigena]
MALRLDVRSVVDALVDSLRERIFSEQLPGGAAVTELEVAAEYDVARPTAKTAIERLVGEGLLVREQHRSARVLLLDADEVEDLYFARGCLEESAMRRLALTRAAVPDEALKAAADMEDALAARDTLTFVDGDIQFHRSFIDALGSARLSRAHGLLLSETRLCMAQVQTHDLIRPTQIIEEHRRILAALQTADPEAAGAAVTEHLLLAKRALTAHLRR